MKTNNIIKEGENVCENNCPDYNGMSILHLEQCECSCHPVLARGEIPQFKGTQEQLDKLTITK